MHALPEPRHLRRQILLQYILHFEPSLDALSVWSHVISSILPAGEIWGKGLGQGLRRRVEGVGAAGATPLARPDPATVIVKGLTTAI